MAASPIAILAIVTLTLTFQAVFFGETIAAKSFPDFQEMDDVCEGDGFFSGISCAVAKVVFFFKVIGGVIGFFWSLISFEVPGTPWYIRVPLATLLIGSTGWSLATLFRGN